MDRDLKTVLVLVEQAFDLDEIVLLENADGFLDVVPHLGFYLAGAVSEYQSEVWVAGFLGLDLLGDYDEAGSDDLVFKLGATGKEEFLHSVRVGADGISIQASIA